MDGPRIVSLIASATEIVTALGLEALLVGRSHECDYPPSVERLPVCSSSKVHVEASSRQIDDQVRTIVGEGLSVYQVDADRLNELAPTLIITQSQCDVCAVSLADVERAVSTLVSSQPRILSLEPMTLGDIWRDIRLVAAAVGRPEQGERLVRTLTTRLDVLRQQTIARPRPTIACIEWVDPLMSAANWVPELVEVAGGANLFGETGRHSGYLDLERLAETDPEVVAIMPCGFGIERTYREMRELAKRMAWSRLSAVRKGRVFITDGNQYFNRPGPRVVESAEILGELLHPGVVDFDHRGRGWIPFSATGSRAVPRN